MSEPNKINPKFDIKNVDAAQLTKAISDHQNSLIKLVLIIGSLILAGWMFNDFRVKGQAIRLQMSQAQEKLEAINTRDTSIQNLNNFKSSLPKKLNEFELITLISNYAKSCHSTITSLSPAESKDMGLYDSTNISFDVASDNFKDMMLFLRKIEKSNIHFRIDSWSGHAEETGKITFKIEISVVYIHP